MRLLLKNGFVYDGSTNDGKICDVLIEDKIIKLIQNNITEEVDQVIDCKGLNVAPGFIDSHSHNDFFVTRKDSDVCISPFICQGITTQIVGNCGFSIIGVDDNTKYKDLVGGGLFKSDKYYSLHDWVKENEGKLDLNVVPLVGHGSTRISASGYKNGKLTDEEKEIMLSLLEQDLKDGAWGGSFGLMYEPGMYSSKEELIEFAKVLKKYDGILTVHPRACSNTSNGFPLFKKHHLELGLNEVVDVMKATNVRCEYSHLIFTGEKSWPRVDSMLSIFHKLKEEGYQIGYDMYSYTYGASVITVLLPPDFMALPLEKRNKGLTYLKAKLLMKITKIVLGLSFEDMTIAYIKDGYEKYEGRLLSDIAKEENMSNVDMYMKLVNLSEGQGRIYLDKYYNKDIIKRLMQDDLSIFMTDAWYEEKGVQNASSYTCYPNFFILADELGIPYKDIIHKMTGKIVDRYKIPNRGYLKEGYYADVTIFDKFTITSPTQNPEGLKYVIINGKVSYQDKKYNNTKSGEFILKK